MEKEDREAILEVLMIFEGKAESYYARMSDQQLEKYYAEYLKKGETYFE